MSVPLSTKNCLGYPFCDKRVEGVEIACRRCWFKLPSRMRNLLKALIYKGAKEETRKKILSDACNFLHPKLKSALNAKTMVSKYTVVPYKGRRVRKVKIKRAAKLKAKYYGGPWDGQR